MEYWHLEGDLIAPPSAVENRFDDLRLSVSANFEEAGDKKKAAEAIAAALNTSSISLSLRVRELEAEVARLKDGANDALAAYRRGFTPETILEELLAPYKEDQHGE